jgi:hypothetical protein
MPSGVLFIHNLRLVPLEQQTTRFRKALAQKAFEGIFQLRLKKLHIKLKNCTQGCADMGKKQAGDKNSYIVEKLYTLG